MKPKRALVSGITGQDGAYLSKLLLNKGYEVHGTSRDHESTNVSRLKKLGILDQVQMHSVTITDFRSVLQAIKQVDPHEIYNLAGQTSVGFSFQQPVETLDSIARGTLNWLEAIRFREKAIKFYNACSSECFGNCPDGGANEETPFRPRSPYAVAKASSFWQLANYREAYGIFACSGILFNHESPLRSARFVTSKIVSAAVEISVGKRKQLELGNLKVIRDWGWAPEFVEAMHLMMQQDDPEDFVIATGKAHQLETFVDLTFGCLGLQWQDHVKINSEFFRPTDIKYSCGSPIKSLEKLGWKSNTDLESIIHRMVEFEKQSPHSL